MGLEAFDVAEDNKGGRKPKEETDDLGYSTEEVEGEPFVEENDTKDWWQEQLEAEVVEQSGETVEDKIPTLSGYVFMHPIPVRIKLEEHGIHETDWDEYIEKYPMYENDERILDHLGEATNTGGGDSTGLAGIASGSSDDDDDDDDSSGGLQSIIDNAK